MIKKPPASARDTGSIAGSGGSPGEEMAAHSSILAWGIPGTGEPGGLQFLGSLTVGHDLETKQQHQYDSTTEDFTSSHKCRFT